MEKKLGFMFFIFVLLLLLQLSELQGAPSVLHDEEGNKKNDWIIGTQNEDKGPEMTQGFSHLMGEEKCEESDEECVKRRMITETHLDYIYTQSHGKP